MIKVKLLVILALLSSGVAFSQVSEYKILNRINLTGDGGWDYLTVDEKGGRLFVSHGTQVHVIDLSTGKQIKAIVGLNGVHGIAIAHDLQQAFISSGRDSSVVVVDLKTLEVTGKVKVTGANPDAILYEPRSRRVFAFNGRSSNATVLDAISHQVMATIPLDGKPEFAQTDGKGKVFVNNEDKSMVYEINAQTLKADRKWSIAPGEEPSGLAIDLVHHRLFSVTDEWMIVSDMQTAKVVATVPIGKNVDGVVYDPALKRIYTSNGEGTVTVVEQVNPNAYKVLETITTQRGARTIAIDTKTHRIYLPTADFGPVPAATKENPEPRPKMIPGTFVILEIGYVNKQ